MAYPKARIDVFVAGIVGGDTQADAFRKAYPASRRWKSDTVYSKASVMANSAEVIEAVALRRAEVMDEAIADAHEIQAFLSGVMRDGEEATGDRIRAAERLSKMRGYDAAAEIKVRNGGVSEDYRCPPNLQKMTTDELRGLLNGD